MKRKSLLNLANQIKAFSGSPLTLDIKDGVGELMLYDFIDPYWGISADAVVKALAGQTLTKLVVRINSPGGDVFDGWAIYNYLKSRPYPVETINDGAAASIASIILMAGSKVRSSAHALIMIHDPWMMSMGNADQLRSDAGLLDKVASDLTAIYAEKSGMVAADVAALMAAETWMSAEEALAYKLIDEIVDTSAAPDAAVTAASALYNCDLPKKNEKPDDRPADSYDPPADAAQTQSRARAKAISDLAAIQ